MRQESQKENSMHPAAGRHEQTDTGQMGYLRTGFVREIARFRRFARLALQATARRHVHLRVFSLSALSERKQPPRTPQNIGDFIEGRVVDFLPTVILYGLGETEETFRMDSYLTNFGVKSTLQYIESGDYKSQPDLQRWSDETRAARRAARGD